MSTVSDRAYFLEQIKGTPMTVSQIKEQFGCADGTARAWVRHEQVERVEGSYPPAYVRKDTLVTSNKVAKTTPANSNKVVVEFDRPSTEEVEAFFRKVLAGDAGDLDFVKEFRAVESQKGLKALINKLKSAYVVSEYYLSLMIKDEIE